MSLDWGRVRTVARREFLATVRRKAFVLTLVGTPLYFVFMFTVVGGSTVGEMRKSISQLKAMGVVDSSGLLAGAERTMRTTFRSDNPFQPRAGAPAPEDVFTAEVRAYPDQAAAEQAVRSGEVGQAIVLPPDYLTTGRVRRYVRSSGVFSEAADRTVSAWLTTNLVISRVEPELARRAARPLRDEIAFKLDKSDRFVPRSDDDEDAGILVPLMFGMALGLCITIGGQYLVQGVVEEKESRILESLLSTIRPIELMAGKLFGLGSVGLVVIAVWGCAGLLAAAPVLARMNLQLPPWMLPVAVAYFVAGYLFFGSLMLGIGAMTNNMREAQQFSVWFTFANMAPLIVLWMVISNPNGPVAVVLSMLPPTAATGMMLRLASPGANVPFWQVAVSLALLAFAAWFSLVVATRIFRIGLLMYGKTPNLPEILRWARRG